MKTLQGKDIVPGLWKYVRFADGTVLFCDACEMWASHKQIIKDREDQSVPPFSAGTIKVKPDGRWAISDGWSSSANLWRSESDEKYIAKCLPPSMKHDVEALYTAFDGDMEWLKQLSGE